MPEPIFARLEYHWCSTSRRMRWFLSVPGSCLDHLPLLTDREGSLEVLRELNAVRLRDGHPRVYVAGL
jgi:hypothetical protein